MLSLLEWKCRTITYSECVSVAVDIQHAMFTRHFIICGEPDVQNISLYLIKLHYFLKRSLLNITCVLIFPTTFFRNISHSKNV